LPALNVDCVRGVWRIAGTPEVALPVLSVLDCDAIADLLSFSSGANYRTVEISLVAACQA